VTGLVVSLNNKVDMQSVYTKRQVNELLSQAEASINNIDKVVIGLGNVDNVSVSNMTLKPSQIEGLNASLGSINDALNLKVNATQLTTAINSVVSDIVGNAPDSLNTLKELADAINDNPLYVKGLATQLTTKANITDSVLLGNTTCEKLTVNGINITESLNNKVNTSSLNKLLVGLDNVDNTSDINKPVSNLMQTDLNKKAPIDQPHFTGDVSMGVVSINDITINRSIQIPNALPSEIAM
jgi:hypothetical protein